MRNRLRSLIVNLPWLAPAAYALALEMRALGYPGGRGVVLSVASALSVLVAASAAQPGVAHYARSTTLLLAALIRPTSLFGDLICQLALAHAVDGWVNQIDQLHGLGGIARVERPMPRVVRWLVVALILASPLGGSGVVASFFTAAAIAGALSAILLRARAIHRLELGVTPRPELGMGLLAVAFLIACAAAPAMPFVWVFRLGTIAVSPIVFLLVTTSRYEWTARVIRRVLAVLALAAVVALATLLFLGVSPARYSAVAFAIALIGVAVGALSTELERMFLPDQGRLIDQVQKSHDHLLRSEPSQSIVKVLDTLRSGTQPGAIFTIVPPTIETVDRAGYLHARAVEIPPYVMDLALAEPLCTVRREVLSEYEVRKPELRPALLWLENNQFQSITLSIADGVTVGALALPCGERLRTLALEEVRIVKALADALVLVLESRAAEARLLADRRARDEALAHAEDIIEARDYALSLEAGRHQAAAHRLARPTAVGLYSPAQRLAYEAIERRVAHGATVIVASDGTLDPIAYLARAHLAGPRKKGALVVVDCTSSREHAIARWRDRAVSPFALSSGGLLVLSDVFCLPLDVQELVARVHLERRPPWEAADLLDLHVALTFCGELSHWRDRGAVQAFFESRFQLSDGAHARLPSLHERAEDLRAVLADGLAREGMRLFGEPLGIETAAVARFFDHPFEGGDVELAFIVQVLARTVKGRAVTADDVERVLHQQRWLVANDGAVMPAKTTWER